MWSLKCLALSHGAQQVHSEKVIVIRPPIVEVEGLAEGLEEEKPCGHQNLQSSFYTYHQIIKVNCLRGVSIKVQKMLNL